MSSYYIAPAFGQMFFFILSLLVMICRPSGLLGQKGTANLGIND
jgi:branched-chain amino acid transport system permease protein